jgi:3-oxoacyl-[acyl-carrier protein] reductase
MENLALVTGADRGIGKAIALAALQNGYSVIVGSLNKISDRKPYYDALHDGATVGFLEFDVTRPDEMQKTVEQITQFTGPITHLINVAGISYFGNILECTEQEWDETLETNVKSYFLLSKAVIPYMIKRESGMIINMSSIWGVRGSPTMLAYSVSKHAVEGLTKSLQEFGRPFGIRVTSVILDKVDTHFRERMEGKVNITPAQCKTMLTADDVATAVIEVANSSNTRHISTVTLEAYKWK